MSSPHSGPDYGSGSPFRAPPPRKRPAWRTWLWILVAITAAIVLGFLLTPHDQPQGPGGPGGRGGRGGGGPGGRPTTVVGVANVVSGDIPIELDALGTATPVATVTVQPRIAGNLTRVDFKEGQMVKAGQLLEEIDDRPYIIAEKQAEGQLLRDQAALDDAKLDLKRYQALNAQDSVAKQTLDTQAALVKQDEGVVVSDQATVANAKLNIEYCHITAPVSGRVGLRQVDAGNYVSESSSSTGLVVITQIDPIDVVFTLPEDSVPQVQARVASGAVLPATALDRSGAQTLGQGTLSTLDNEIDTSTGTVKAKARFANAEGQLFPNQFVNIKLLVDTIHDALIVPTQAVRHGSQGDYVFTVDLDQNAKMTPVKVGPIDGERTSILSGVQLGDMVITDGGDRLHDGSPVTLPADAAAMQTAPPPAKPIGFFGWLAGLFGHKPAAVAGAASGAQGAQASASSGAAAPGGGAGGWAGHAGGAGGWSGHGGGGGAHLQAIVSTLGLSPDQMAKARPIFADMHAKSAAAGDDFNARRAAMQAGIAQFEAILTPDQKAKFEQARAQQRAQAGGPGGGWPGAGGQGGAASASAAAPSGAPAPTSSAPAAPAAHAGWSGGPGGAGGGHGGGRFAAMIAGLGLSPDQKAKADAIQADMASKMASADDPDARHAIMQAAMAQLDAILTPDQKAKLEQQRAQQRAAGGWGGGGAQ